MKKYSKGIVVGIDVSDAKSELCVMDKASGEILERRRIKTEEGSVKEYFNELGTGLVILEVGTHSPWLSRLIKGMGYEVIIANARRVRLIHGTKRKNDRVDAEKLARLGRVDESLLYPVEHRSKEQQADLNVIRARDLLIKTRQQQINHVRAVLKSHGIKVPTMSTASFHKKAVAYIAEELRPALMPLIEALKGTQTSIRELEKRIAVLAEEKYPETELLTRITGVGQLIALTFILTLSDPKKFKKSRSVGAYLGLAPGQDQSGANNPKQPITKEGDPLLRRLLVQASNYILGPFGPDCDLRRFAYDRLEKEKEILKAKGKDPNKVKVSKQLKVAVTRKLAVLLHHLWDTAEVYDPFYNSNQQNFKQDTTVLRKAKAI